MSIREFESLEFKVSTHSYRDEFINRNLSGSIFLFFKIREYNIKIVSYTL